MKPKLIATGLLLAALLSLGWWVRQLTPPSSQPREAGTETPDAIADSLTVHTYDTEGRLQQTLVTPHMEHFASTQTSQLTQPELWQYDNDTPPWHMQAEQALANDETQQIYLPGEVVINRAGASGIAPYHIVTRDLTLQTDTAYATTQQPVLIESAEQRITAVGLEGWLRAPIKLNLLNQVRGRYVFD